MAYHVLHILQHGALLGKERGFLVCRHTNQSKVEERRLPLEDVRAVVIAARGVTLTSNAISALLEAEVVILHCNERYQPCGFTAPLPRVIDLRVFNGQIRRPARLNNVIWNRLLLGKTENQIAVLTRLDCESAYLERSLKSKKIDEGNCAREYWKNYFPAIGWITSRRDRRLEDPPNRLLNYGYAVLASLCHRALLIHGLDPLLGVGHVARYRSTPLVYDVMEPLRPFVDQLLADYVTMPDRTQEGWARFIGANLRDQRVRCRPSSLKLIDALDKLASSLARSYAETDAGRLWLPLLDRAA